VLLFMQNLQGTAPPIVGDNLPSLVGQTYLQAATTLGNLGFVSFTLAVDYFADGEYSEDVAADLVLEQSPAAGTFALFGAFITIGRSLGPNPTLGEVSRMRFTPYYSRMRFKVL
jgi:beta-lactam-binding protein with PASTA domain